MSPTPSTAPQHLAGKVPGSPPRPRPPWSLLVPLALSAAAYARVLRGELLFDDWFTIVRNPRVREPGAALARLSAWLDGGRPLTDLTFALNYAIGGIDPLGYHLVNVALHLGVALLVFLFTREVLRLAGAGEEVGLAIAVAGLFAVHPLHAQAVSYVSQRSEVLASGLYLASLLLLLRVETAGTRARGVAAWTGALALFVAALAAKPIALTLPVAYLLLVTVVPAPGRRLAPWRRHLALAAPFLAIVGVVAVRTLRALEGRPDAGFAVPAAATGSYFLTQWRVVALYARLLLWPSGQRVEWDLEPSRGLAEPGVLVAGLVLLALLGAAAAVLWLSRRRVDRDAALGRAAAYGVLWFFLVLSVTSSVVPLADLVMEHRVYLASWGFLAAACASARVGLTRALGTRAGRAGGTLAALAWVMLAGALHVRNAAWESNAALWSDAVEKSPRSARAHMNVGHASKQAGDLATAVREYETALGLAGASSDLRAAILRNLGAAHLRGGDTRLAIETLRQALAVSPREPEVLTNLAVALHRQGDSAAAESFALSALRQDRNQPEALTVLGAIRMEQDDAGSSLAFLEEAARIDPDVPMRHVNVGVAYDRLGRTAEACAAWRRALALGLGGAARAAVSTRAEARGCR